MPKTTKKPSTTKRDANKDHKHRAKLDKVQNTAQDQLKDVPNDEQNDFMMALLEEMQESRENQFPGSAQTGAGDPDEEGDGDDDND